MEFLDLAVLGLHGVALGPVLAEDSRRVEVQTEFVGPVTGGVGEEADLISMLLLIYFSWLGESGFDIELNSLWGV